MTDKIQKTLIEVALKIAKQGKGCLFVIKEFDFKYDLMFGQDIKSFSIFGNERRLELLAIQDGACIIDMEGNLIDYGARIKDTKTLEGFGTRHSAGYTASLTGNLVILASEEDRKVKLFKSGKIIMQFDALEKDIEKNIPKAVDFLEAISVGSLAAIGSPMLFPAAMAGITITSGIIIFSSGYYFLIKIIDKAKYFFKNGTNK